MKAELHLAAAFVMAATTSVLATTDASTPNQVLSPSADALGWGSAMAVEGDLAVLGHKLDSGNGQQAGAATLLTRQIDLSNPDRPWNWVAGGRLEPADDHTMSWFGAALDMSGMHVIVGAPKWDADTTAPDGMPPSTADGGGVWIFDASQPPNEAGVISPQAQLTIEGLRAGDYLGCAVAIDGGVAVVGAWGRDVYPLIGDHTGAAWVFEQQNDGSWLQVAQLTAPSLAAGDRFGWAVAISGNYLVVSAPRSGDDVGEVHAYKRIEGVWQWIQTIENPTGSAHARFGTSLAILMGDVDNDGGEGGGFAAGAPGDGAAGTQSGTVWGFAYSESQAMYDESAPIHFVADDAAPFDASGTSISIVHVDDDDEGEGDGGNDDDGGGNTVLLAGAPGADGGSGVVHIWSIGESDIPEYFERVPSMPGASHFGQSLATDWALLDEWDVSIVWIFVAAPDAGDSQLGDIALHEAITGDSGGDCDDNGRWDFLDLADGIGDCDGDGNFDACQVVYDPASDCDGNGVVDSCEVDLDGDGVTDACDNDIDGDGVDNGEDAFPLDATEWADSDGDGIGDNADPDDDNDGVLDDCDADQTQGEDCDGNGILDACEPDDDCNQNGMNDACEPDLDGDGVIDDCDDDIDGDGVDNGEDAFPLDPTEWADADGDGIGDNADPDDDNDGVSDDCDADQTSGDDCDGNGVLDFCELNGQTDCDGNGVIDSCELNVITDCDESGVLDICELNAQTDCDGDGMLDQCQTNSSNDCNSDGVLDDCQLDEFTDCNQDGILDNCQIDSTTDCDNNGELDECQADPLEDCDQDGNPDVCQLNSQTDCNDNGILDLCESGYQDCDENGVADVCQIQSDPAMDCNADGVLDTCQQLGGLEAPIWATERFIDDFDLDSLGLSLHDSDSDLLYDFCTIDPPSGWITAPYGATDIHLEDDDSVLISLPFTFEFFGQSYTEVHVGSNGYLCFGAEGDSTYIESLARHFDRPRISAMFDDLDPSEPGAQVVHGQGTSGSVHFSWIDVPRYDETGLNSFQIVLYPDGGIDMAWVATDPGTSVIGLSGGGGIPPGFVETDLSNAWPIDGCQAVVPPGYGDCNDNGIPDNCEIVPSGDPNWMTEQFITSFDLAGHVVQLNPMTAGPPDWSICSDDTAAAVFIQPVQGEVLPQEDDASYLRSIPFSFDFAGNLWQDCYISTNGYITFGTADTDYTESITAHFNLPRISALFHDLNPEISGYVHVGVGPAGSFVVTWFQVPSFGDTDRISTAQAQLHPDGAVTLVWLGVDAPNAVVGVSDGLGIPLDFTGTDLSGAFDCIARIALDDCNANGIHDAIEITLGCAQDVDLDGIPDECGVNNGAFGAPLCMGDTDGDGDIDIRDLIQVLSCWHSADSLCQASDLNADGTVNALDLVVLLDRLGEGCN